MADMRAGQQAIDELFGHIPDEDVTPLPLPEEPDAAFPGRPGESVRCSRCPAILGGPDSLRSHEATHDNDEIARRHLDDSGREEVLP